MKLLRTLVLLPTLLHASPGSLLDSSFPSFSSQATVTETALAADGSVFLIGDFTSVDGIARPGLAKLTPGGLLDPAFKPPAIETSANFPFAYFGYPGVPGPLIFALPKGRLMCLGDQSWTLLNADGRPNETLLADLARSGTTAPRPQFVSASRIFIIASGEPALRAYRTSDLLPDPQFNAAAGPKPPVQAIPAADGKTWVLGSTPEENPIFSYPPAASYTLFRLEENGSLDAGFPPRDLPEDYSYSLQTAPGGGFRLISEWLGGYGYSPAASNRSMNVKRHNSEGTVVGNVNYPTPFSWSSGNAVFQDDLVIYPSFNKLVRSQPGTWLPDPAFSVPLAAPEVPVRGALVSRTIADFPDGKLLVGGARRLLADGSVDPSWHSPRLTRTPVISHLVRLADGSLLASGDFDLADGLPAAGVIKLRADDTRDPDFSPTFDFRLALKIRPFPDGTLLALFKIPAMDPAGSHSQLVRFDANGGFLSLWPVPDPPGSATFYYGTVTDFAIQADGTTLVSTFQNIEIPTVGFQRILPDGTSPLFFPGGFLNSGIVGSLLLLQDGTYLRGNRRFAADGTLLGALEGVVLQNPVVQLADRSVIFVKPSSFGGGSYFQRWHPDTGVDHAFYDPFAGRADVQINGVSAAAHGKLLVYGNFGSQSVVRLHSTGQLDPTFRPPVGNFLESLVEPGGGILVAGEFDALDGQPRSGLARLADSRAVGFNEWIVAATTRRGFAAADLASTADPDRDGSSNFLEYAAASDPGQPDSSRSQAIRNGPFTWMIPCNPEAPEILRRLETTTDFSRWQPARADQIRLETNRATLTWTLIPGAPKLFSRVRIE